MNYVAIYVNAKGDIIRNEQTGKVLNIPVGDLESPDAAIKEACSILGCYSLQNGVIWKSSGAGGFLVRHAQGFM